MLEKASRPCARAAALCVPRRCSSTARASSRRADELDRAVLRAVEAAFLHFEAGDSRRAEAQLVRSSSHSRRVQAGARALVVLARVRLYEAPDEARELFVQVVEEANDDRRTLALAHEGVAACSTWMFEGFEDALAPRRRRLALPADLGDEAWLRMCCMVGLSAETLLGRPTATETARSSPGLRSPPPACESSISLSSHSPRT